MWPILRALGVTMLHRIDVDVIDVILQITFVADDVFIKTARPNAALASHTSAGRKRFIDHRDCLTKPLLGYTRSLQFRDPLNAIVSPGVTWRIQFSLAPRAAVTLPIAAKTPAGVGLPSAVARPIRLEITFRTLRTPAIAR